VNSEFWAWETLIMVHLKIDARKITDEEEFFDLCARVKFARDQELKMAQMQWGAQ